MKSPICMKSLIGACITIIGIIIFGVAFWHANIEKQTIVESHLVLNENTGKYDKKFKEVTHIPIYIPILLVIGLITIPAGIILFINYAVE